MALFMDVKYQEGAKTYTPIIHRPFESPGATGSVVTTKKEAMSEPYVGGAEVSAPTGDIQTSDYTVLIIGVAIIGAIAWAYTSKQKKR